MQAVSTTIGRYNNNALLDEHTEDNYDICIEEFSHLIQAAKTYMTIDLIYNGDIFGQTTTVERIFGDLANYADKNMKDVIQVLIHTFQPIIDNYAEKYADIELSCMYYTLVNINLFIDENVFDKEPDSSYKCSNRVRSLCGDVVKYLLSQKKTELCTIYNSYKILPFIILHPIHT